MLYTIQRKHQPIVGQIAINMVKDVSSPHQKRNEDRTNEEIKQLRQT